MQLETKEHEVPGSTLLYLVCWPKFSTQLVYGGVLPDHGAIKKIRNKFLKVHLTLIPRIRSNEGVIITGEVLGEELVRNGICKG